jgi:hypothetical protein
VQFLFDDPTVTKVQVDPSRKLASHSLLREGRLPKNWNYQHAGRRCNFDDRGTGWLDITASYPSSGQRFHRAQVTVVPVESLLDEVIALHEVPHVEQSVSLVFGWRSQEAKHGDLAGI